MNMQGMMNCCMKMAEQKNGKKMECPMMNDSGKTESQSSPKQ